MLSIAASDQRESAGTPYTDRHWLLVAEQTAPATPMRGSGRFNSCLQSRFDRTAVGTKNDSVSYLAYTVELAEAL